MAQSFTVPEVGDLVVGRYRIEAEIGRGGFGVVFRATQMGMERKVALKTLLPSAMVKQDAVERFRREAILARNLNHPNTIRLFDFGQTEGGLLYIAMEYLDGHTLREVLQTSGPLSPERVQRIGIQILKSLAEAHQHDVVHRDLKPANIFLRELIGEEDFVKVLDFGIAKALDVEEGDRLTETGIGFGTPYYMAPEQVRGKNIRPSTDLYALGLLLAECLTGSTVFQGESSMDVAVQQLSDEPAPIPSLVLRGPLGPVIQRATQKEQSLRYPSAIEMLRDLKSVDPTASLEVSAKLSGKVAQARAEALAAKKTTRKHIALGALIATVVLVALGLGASAFFSDDTKTPSPSDTAAAITPAKPATPPAGASAGAQAAAPAAEPDPNTQEAPKTPEAPPETVTVTFKTTPEGADVYDGGEMIVLGTPGTFEFPRSADATKALEVKLDGYKTQRVEVLLAEDRTVEVTLEATQAAPRHATAAKAPTKPTAGGRARAAKLRVKPAAAKPATQTKPTPKPKPAAKPKPTPEFRMPSL